MLPLQHRITKEKDFKFVFKNSKRLETVNFSIYQTVNKNHTNSSNKLGIIISTEFGKANKRNLLKRRLKYLFRMSEFIKRSNGVLLVLRVKTKYNESLCIQNLKKELNLWLS